MLALADSGLPAIQREKMASKLHSFERKKIEGGKPVFPFIDLSGLGDGIPDMDSFVTVDSWLVFDLLDLTSTQDWMTIPSSLWDKFEDYRKFKEFAESVSVCNDVAERGIALISAYINKAQSEEQRQALLQVVEFHRSLITNMNKSSLKNC